jgi:HIRAN domain
MLAILLIVLIAGVVIAYLYKKSTPKPKTEEEASDNVFFAKVHGVSYKNDDGSSRQKIISRCKVGEELDIIPEPTNRHDPGAMKVCRKNGEQLGYWHAGGRMPSAITPNAPNPQGTSWRVTIKNIYPVIAEPGMKGVNVRVEITW